MVFYFKRNLNYLITKLYLCLKSLKEYKIDLYFSLISNFVFLIVYYVFYIIFFNFIGILNWNNSDYLLFFVACWIGSLNSLNFSLRNFHKTLLEGNLNRYLCIPINKYLGACLDTTSGKNLFTVILNVIVFVLIVFFVKYNVFLLLFSLLLLFVGSFSFAIITNFIFVFSFYFKGIHLLYNSFFKEVIYLNEKFTPVLFEKNIFKSFFYMLPSAFYGYFVIEVLKGNFDKLLVYLPYFIILNLLLIILTYLIWKKGIMKYEAYG